MRFGGVLLVLGGLLFGVFGAGIASHASGLLGTRGTFTVERCEHHETKQRGGGHGKDVVDCFGTFLPSGGGQARAGLGIDREYSPGRRVTASCDFIRICYKIDRVNACGWFAGLLAGLMMLCLGGPGVVRGAAWLTGPYDRGRMVQGRLVKGLFWPALAFLVVFVVLRVTL
ncbi:hypothetical protein ACSNOK_28120 [Streptomyces sp. URMC 126]|uniref:hypothetical protein n=1 Tax=Streptomyces sp. URMC 126 TaxID=3423401 RepID=UPI003F1DD478